MFSDTQAEHASYISDEQTSIAMTELGRLAVRTFRGDKRAESRLMEQLYVAVKNHLRHKISNTEDLNDLIQDTLELALKKIRAGMLQQADSVKSYAIGISERVAKTHYRQTQRKWQAMGQLKDEPILSSELEETITPAKQFDRGIWHHELQTKLKCLKKQRDRLFMIRFYYHGEPVKSIASHYRITEEHGFRVLHRARKRLKQLISPAMLQTH